MKKIILTHVDLDGIGCAIVLRYLKIKYDVMLNCDYDSFEKKEFVDKILEFDEIMFTDFSPTKEAYDILIENNKVITVLDHHESSKWLTEEKSPLLTLSHNQLKSGTLLTLEFLTKNIRIKKSLVQFANLVNCYDLFKEDDPLWEEAQNMNRILWQSISWDNEENKFGFITDFWLDKILKSDSWSWTQYEKDKIKRAVKVENEEFIKSKVSFKTQIDSKGIKYGVTVASKKVSIIANRLLKEFPDIAYCAIINTYDGWNKISLRSRDPKEFNCTSIAEGHECAAGMKVEPENAKAFYAGTYQLIYK